MRKIRSLAFAVIVGIATFTVGVVTARATVLAIDTTGGVLAEATGPFTYGHKFTLTSPYAVDGLGFFDAQTPGVTPNTLHNSHEVGIYTTAGSLVVGVATITNASSSVASASALGDWRFETVPTTVLTPGDYVIASVVGIGSDCDTNNDCFPTSGVVMGVPQNEMFVDIPEVLRFSTSLKSFPGSTTLVFPTITVTGFTSTPASFRGTVVPLPASVWLFGSGLMGLIGLARRKKA